MNSSALTLGELLVEGDDDELPHPEPFDHVALDLEGHDQLRQRRRVQDLERVGIEGEHGVGALDHRLVAAVDAVEGADRDLARPRLGVGQRGDLDAHRSASSQRLRQPPGPARRPARARSPRRRPRSGRARSRCAAAPRSRRPRASRSGCGRRCRPSTRSRSGRVAALAARAAPPGRPRPRAPASRPSRHGEPCGRGARRRPAPPRSSARAGAPVPVGSSRELGTPPGLGQLPVGIAGAGAPAEPGRRQVGLRQAGEEALQPGRRARAGSAAGRSRTGRGFPRGPPCSRARAGPAQPCRARLSRPACRRAGRPLAGAGHVRGRAGRRPRGRGT